MAETERAFIWPRQTATDFGILAAVGTRHRLAACIVTTALAGGEIALDHGHTPDVGR